MHTFFHKLACCLYCRHIFLHNHPKSVHHLTKVCSLNSFTFTGTQPYFPPFFAFCFCLRMFYPNRFAALLMVISSSAVIDQAHLQTSLHVLMNREFVGDKFWTVKNFGPEFPINPRTARSDYDLNPRADYALAMNPKIYQFVTICGTSGRSVIPHNVYP